MLLCLAMGTATLYMPIRRWQEWGGPLLLAVLLLLLAVLVAGHSVNGAKRWLGFGGFNLV